jgi:hypothetical protein
MTRQYICDLDDEALVDYVQTGVPTYDPNAVAFAANELERRRLDPGRLSALVENFRDHAQAAEQEAAEAAVRPLGMGEGAVVFLLGFVGVLPVGLFAVRLLARDYRARGEFLRVRQTWTLGLMAIVAGIMVFTAIICVAMQPQ